SQQVTKTLSATSNNMMNNNLNDTMKFLTVWSLVLTIPTILTGFYGMNVSLPILKNSFDWILIIVLMVVLMVWLVVLMKKHHIYERGNLMNHKILVSSIISTLLTFILYTSNRRRDENAQ